MDEPPNLPSDAEAAARLLEAAFFQNDDGIGQVASDLDSDLPLVRGYRLIQLLGEGGFGMVYQAEQEYPIRRGVALKILRPGFTTRELLARFEQERQALALMNHPHIARIHDAGETDDGRPFIAMEMVDGPTIDRYAQQASPHETVAMMARVCHAVAHAHHKGIIHRDLKPSNILVATTVDGMAEPRIIDFGIAKALEGPLITRVFFTGIRQMVGTPGYMGPERQSSAPSGQPADTRSDVFALGAILWELLSGQRPSIQTEGAMLRVDLPAGKPVARELRWIAEMATAVDLDRRYPDAATMAADLDAWLAGQPVRAAPPGVGYRIGKWAALHPMASTAMVAALIGLLAATTVITVQNGRIRRQVADLQSAAAEARVRSAEQAFLLGLQAVGDSPLEAVLHWGECLRLAPDHPRAGGHLASAIRQEHLVAFLGESPALPAGNWKEARISPDGNWIATCTPSGEGRTILVMQRGGSWRPPVEAPDTAGPWVVDDRGGIWFSMRGAKIACVDGLGAVAIEACPIQGLRYLTALPGGVIAAAGVDGFGWREPDGRWRLSPLRTMPEAMAVSRDGSTLVVAAGRFLHRWQSAEETPVTIPKSIPAPASALALSEDGRIASAGWRDGTVQILEGVEDRGRFRTEATALDHYLTAGGSTLISRSPDGICWRDTKTGTLLSRWESPRVARWCLPVGRSAAITSPAGGGVVVLDARDPQATGWSLPGAGGKGAVAFARDGKTFVLYDETSRTFRWFEVRPASDPVLTTIPFPERPLALAIDAKSMVSSVDASGVVRSSGASWTAAGAPFRIAALSAGGGLLVADRLDAPGVVVARSDGTSVDRDWVKSSSVAVSPGGRWLALGSPGGRFQVISPDLEAPTLDHTIPGNSITRIAVSDQGRVAAFAGGQVHLRGGGGETAAFATQGEAHAMGFSPDGRRLAIAFDDGRIDWLDASGGEPVALPARVSGTVLHLGWTPDGKTLRAVLADGWMEFLLASDVPSSDSAGSLGWRVDRSGRIMPMSP